jgi:predicted transposase/invertase (TIGR01784 family)
MARYLDPKNDLTFKRVFGEHPDLLKSFLNALMPFEPDQYIVELEYLQSEQVPDNPGKKNSIVDVKCIDNYKRQFIVEMQMDWDEVFMNRIVFNAGKAYVKQLKRHDAYHLLHPVYTLAILNDNFDHKTSEFYHRFQIINRDNPEEVIHGLEFVLIELVKFLPEKISDRKMAVLWLRFLKEVNEDMSILPSEMQENEDINQAAELCMEGAFTPEELAAYDNYWDIVRTEIARRESARIKGEAKGLAIGWEKGLEQAVIEGNRNGFSVEQIKLFTKLSKEKIIEILKKQ